jgi:hypothetical protein
MPDKNDLSHVFANPDLDEAQEEYDNLPEEMRDHLWKAMLHNAGLGPDPGKYKGPDIPKH